MPSVVVQDPAAGGWLRFSQPAEIITAERLHQVGPAVQRLAAGVAAGWHAAGWLSYEAAPAFDAALRTHPADGALPLVWFGLFPAPEVIPPPAPGAGGYSLGAWTPTVTEAGYHAALVRIKDHIARGDTYQVNYTYRLRAPFAGDPWALFVDLAAAQRAAHGAYVDTGRWAACSASPELFFQLEGRRLTARPMKGTAARGRTLAEDEAQAAWLQASEKNRAENVMIVDMLRNDLGRVARLGSVAVPTLFAAERYPTLWQMTSTVTAESAAGLPELLAALFPCASITGAPKPRTMRLIAELETTPRRLYTGAIGYLTPGSLETRRARFNVAIRTALVNRAAGQAEYGVGGGIVWDSDPAEEWEESQLKARVLRPAPPAFELLESLRWEPEHGYFLLERHLARLQASAVYFGWPVEAAAARARLAALAAALPAVPHKVRLLADSAGGLRAEAAPLPAWPPDGGAPAAAPVRLQVAPRPVSSADIFLFHKTTHRAVYEAARAACPAADDVVLWNEHGDLTETCLSNLALELDGVWVTPPVASGLLAGTYRAQLLAEGRLCERRLPRAGLAQATRLAVINSVRGWRPAQLEPGRPD